MSVLAILQSLGKKPGVLITALRMIPLVIISVSAAPAVLVLPFFPQGHKRAMELVGHLKAWSLGQWDEQMKEPSSKAETESKESRTEDGSVESDSENDSDEFVDTPGGRSGTEEASALSEDT
ncbi:hypothetical protein ACFVW1_43310 [Streptomyces olivochromogenes]|uniref:hypothetical protein n=1 Tax=Streptomyces olivochromogenes TaxID=1963 RepID=UPI0036DC1F0B